MWTNLVLTEWIQKEEQENPKIGDRHSRWIKAKRNSNARTEGIQGIAMIDNLIGPLIDSPQGMREFQRERLFVDVTDRICQLMKEQGLSRVDLANRLGVTKGRVSRLLSGSTNMTLGTLSDVMAALGRAAFVDDCDLSKSLLEPPRAMPLAGFMNDRSQPVRWTAPTDGSGARAT
jgi:transcriptional regulator with XRE-family HTH domain